MRFVDGEPFDGVSEIIRAAVLARGLRRKFQVGGVNDLGGGFARDEVCQMTGIGNILQIAIGRAVADEIFHHAAPRRMA